MNFPVFFSFFLSNLRCHTAFFPSIFIEITQKCLLVRVFLSPPFIIGRTRQMSVFHSIMMCNGINYGWFIRSYYFRCCNRKQLCTIIWQLNVITFAVSMTFQNEIDISIVEIEWRVYFWRPIFSFENRQKHTLLSISPQHIRVNVLFATSCRFALVFSSIPKNESKTQFTTATFSILVSFSTIIIIIIIANFPAAHWKKTSF